MSMIATKTLIPFLGGGWGKGWWDAKRIGSTSRILETPILYGVAKMRECDHSE